MLKEFPGKVLEWLKSWKAAKVTEITVQLTSVLGAADYEWTKRSEETQTLRAGCSKAEPKIFVPPQTPFPGAQDGQNLISWRWSLPSPTNTVWWGSMHAIYRGNRPTNTYTQTGPITIHGAAASAQCITREKVILLLTSSSVRKGHHRHISQCLKCHGLLELVSHQLVAASSYLITAIHLPRGNQRA